MRISNYSRTRNYGDHDADNLTIGDKHYTQPSGRRADLWATYHEVQRKSAEWFREMGEGTQVVDANRVNQYHELQLLNKPNE